MLPVFSHGSGFHFAVNVTLHDEGEKPKPLVGLKQWVCVDLIRQIGRDDGQRALIAFDVRANSAQSRVQCVPLVACDSKSLFRCRKVRSRTRPVV